MTTAGHYGGPPFVHLPHTNDIQEKNTIMENITASRIAPMVENFAFPDPPDNPDPPVREPPPPPTPQKDPVPERPVPTPVPGTPSITPQEVPTHPGQPLQPGTQHPADPNPQQPSGRLRLVIIPE